MSAMSSGVRFALCAEPLYFACQTMSPTAAATATATAIIALVVAFKINSLPFSTSLKIRPATPDGTGQARLDNALRYIKNGPHALRQGPFPAGLGDYGRRAGRLFVAVGFGFDAALGLVAAGAPAPLAGAAADTSTG